MTQPLVRLPVRLFPDEGEGVRGYLQRLAIPNGLERIQQFGKNGMLSPEDMTVLLDRDDSRFWMKHPQSAYWEKDNALKKVHWNWATRRCCPICLAENPIWRLEWEMRGLAVCHVHGVNLIDTCPSCKKELSWNTTQLTHCTCGFDLRAVETEHCTEQEVYLAKAFSAAVGQGECPESAINLKGMPPSNLFHLVYFLGKFGAGQDEVKISKTTSMSEIAPLFKEAATTLSDWPNNYHAWITRLKGEEGTPVIGTRIPEVFGKAYRYIYRKLYDKPYNFIRREFESYLVNKWCWQLNNRNKRIPAELRGDSSWITTSDAATQLKTGIRHVQHLVAGGHLDGVIMTSRAGSVLMSINRNDLGRAQKHLADIANLSRACEITGLSENRIFELLEGEILHPIASIGNSGTGQWQFSMSELSLITSYCGDAISQPEVKEGELLMKNLLKSGLRGRGALSNLLRQIFLDKITVVARLNDCNGISGWIINRQVYDYWIREQIGNRATGYTVQEASKILEVKEEVAYALVRNGLIKAETQTLHGRKFSFVTPAQLKAFKDEYVTGCLLAKEHGTSPKKLLKMMADEGILPVAGPGVDGCRQAIFERKAVEGTIRYRNTNT